MPRVESIDERGSRGVRWFELRGHESINAKGNMIMSGKTLGEREGCSNDMQTNLVG